MSNRKMIYLDDAVKALEQAYPNDGQMSCHDAIAVIGTATTIEPSAQPNWIPCSERLPEIEELVLVTDDSGGVKTVDVDRCGQYERSKKRFWYYAQNVVAWMPLPKPYKGEDV